MVREFATRHGSALRSLAMLVGMLATAAAVLVGAILAVFFAATVALIAIMTSALLGFAGLALRARRTAHAPRRRRHRSPPPGRPPLGGLRLERKPLTRPAICCDAA